MPKACDHKSVGMLVWKDDKLLLIERAKFPVAFSIPAGHVDDDSSFEDAATRELEEEVGLTAEKLDLIAEGRKENKCRRKGGMWHYWKLYTVTATGSVHRSLDETKQAVWYTKEDMQTLADKTKKYERKEVSEKEWAASPGLEPVMCDWFTELGIIS